MILNLRNKFVFVFFEKYFSGSFWIDYDFIPSLLSHLKRVIFFLRKVIYVWGSKLFVFCSVESMNFLVNKKQKQSIINSIYLDCSILCVIKGMFIFYLKKIKKKIETRVIHHEK